MFCEILFLTYKPGMYELPHESLNDLESGKESGNIKKALKLQRTIT